MISAFTQDSKLKCLEKSQNLGNSASILGNGSVALVRLPLHPPDCQCGKASHHNVDAPSWFSDSVQAFRITSSVVEQRRGCRSAQEPLGTPSNAPGAESAISSPIETQSSF